MNPVMRRDPNCAAARSQTIRRRLGSVTSGQGLGLGTSLFPVGAMEIKARISAYNGIVSNDGCSTRPPSCVECFNHEYSRVLKGIKASKQSISWYVLVYPARVITFSDTLQLLNAYRCACSVDIFFLQCITNKDEASTSNIVYPGDCVYHRVLLHQRVLLSH